MPRGRLVSAGYYLLLSSLRLSSLLPFHYHPLLSLFCRPLPLTQTLSHTHAHANTGCAMRIGKELREMGVSSSAGVTTGEVYCGLVGGETRCEYALIGDVVNMAARLMASTADDIRVDLETYDRSCKRVLFERLDPIRVKGKVAKIKVFRPVAGSVSAALSLRKTPLIGRSEDMELITARVDAFNDLSASHTIILQGEAGVGKTRFLEEVVTVLHKHKLHLKPKQAHYEAMSQDATLNFMGSVLQEFWNL